MGYKIIRAWWRKTKIILLGGVPATATFSMIVSILCSVSKQGNYNNI